MSDQFSVAVRPTSGAPFVSLPAGRDRQRFRFPETVNEVAARVVATGVVALTLSYLLTGSGWILALLLYGFAARVFAGPTLSPLAQFATRVVVPALPFAERLVPGQPKRFAQSVGVTLALTASVLHVAGADTAAFGLVAAITIAAMLESAFGLCLGCIAFGWFIRIGLIPEATCVACANTSERLANATSGSSHPGERTQ